MSIGIPSQASIPFQATFDPLLYDYWLLMFLGSFYIDAHSTRSSTDLRHNWASGVDKGFDGPPRADLQSFEAIKANKEPSYPLHFTANVSKFGQCQLALDFKYPLWSYSLGF